MTRGLFRWKAISALAFVLLLMGTLWLILGDWAVRRGVESVGSQLLGAEVDVASLTVHTARRSIEMGGLQVANPFDSTKNLVEAGAIAFDLEAAPLLEKKVIVNKLTLTGLRFMTTRGTPARSYASKDGIASKLLAETQAWVKRVNVPLLSLTPIDTIKSLVLDPSSLGTIKAVDQLTKRADSVKDAFQKQLADLHLQALADSIKLLAQQLSAVKPNELGVLGAAQQVQAAKHGIDQIEQARKQVLDLEKRTRAAADLLANGVRAVDSARRADYEFAKNLLRLPKLDAPNLGAALFGPVSLARLQQVVYWSRLAQEYIPPGLQPWRRTGAERARMAGTTFSFQAQNTDPTFLLRTGDLSFALGGDQTASSFTGTVTGLTTQPQVYGKPATLKASGGTKGVHAITGDLGAMLDHTRSPTHDSARVRLEGLEIPGFALPGLPFAVDPGRGSTDLSLEVEGGRLSGRWSLRTAQAAWRLDSAKAGKLSTLESVLWRVVSGLNDLDITATVSGQLNAPQLAVTSNIDKELEQRLRAILGEELAKAEAKARAAVDKLVAVKVDPIVKQVAGVSSILDQQLGGSKTQLDQLQKQLEHEIARLGGPASLFTLPKPKP
jgi:uncharacterized protein (TIGR03545 family)